MSNEIFDPPSTLSLGTKRDPDEDEYEVQQGRFDTGVSIQERKVPE